MNVKEIYSIREWAPLTDVLERIPTRIFPDKFDISITCCDALDNFLALGSDVGIVFWYNRQSGAVQRFKTESSSAVTCVKIVDTVEYMVAAGTSDGQVYAFQIPKELPPDLIIITPSSRKKTNQRFTTTKLHDVQICCCEWSKNGMKLYSGDCKGVVVLTEFDYQVHRCTSVEILNEAYAIVQLSVHQGYLLVSTQYRSIVCVKKNNNWSVVQIGTKDRKHIVNCGGTFLKHSYDKPPHLICARPNLRLILADADGTVNKTLLYRDPVLYNSTWEIPILNPKVISNRSMFHHTPIKNESRNFHRLYTYGRETPLIVTHDGIGLYILNTEKLQIEAVANGLRKIIDFCVCNKEIFILEGGRTLIRLAPVPEKPNSTVQIIYNPTLPPPLPSYRSSTIAIEQPIEYEPEDSVVLTNEECPTECGINLEVYVELAIESPTANHNRRMQLFQNISERPFDENILHQSSRKIVHKPKGSKVFAKRGGVVEIGLAATELKHNKSSLLDIKCNGIDDILYNGLEYVNSTSKKYFGHRNDNAQRNRSPINTYQQINSVRRLEETIEHHDDEKMSGDKLHLDSDNVNDGRLLDYHIKSEYIENYSQEFTKGAIRKIPLNVSSLRNKDNDKDKNKDIAKECNVKCKTTLLDVHCPVSNEEDR